MNSNSSPKSSQTRIRSLRPGGREVVLPAAPTTAQVKPRSRVRVLFWRLVQLFTKASAKFVDWVFPYLKSPFALVYAVAAILIMGGIVNATLSQAARYLGDGYVLYAPFASLRDPALSFWHYGLYFFIAPILGVTSACIAGLALAYLSLGLGVGAVIWYAGWGSSNFYQYTLPGIIALIQCGLMVTVFKRTASVIFSGVIWLYVVVVAAFWAFLLFFTCITWLHCLIDWSMRPAG